MEAYLNYDTTIVFCFVLLNLFSVEKTSQRPGAFLLFYKSLFVQHLPPVQSPSKSPPRQSHPGHFILDSQSQLEWATPPAANSGHRACPSSPLLHSPVGLPVTHSSDCPPRGSLEPALAEPPGWPLMTIFWSPKSSPAAVERLMCSPSTGAAWPFQTSSNSFPCAGSQASDWQASCHTISSQQPEECSTHLCPWQPASEPGHLHRYSDSHQSCLILRFPSLALSFCNSPGPWVWVFMLPSTHCFSHPESL